MALETLSLSLQFGALEDAALHRAALPRHSVSRWIRHALKSDAEITVRIVDAEEGQALNRDYRGKDYATNVLTFDYTQAPFVTADLVLCAPVVDREAKDSHKTLQAHHATPPTPAHPQAQAYDHEPTRPDAPALGTLELPLPAAPGSDNPT